MVERQKFVNLMVISYDAMEEYDSDRIEIQAL